MSYLLGNQVEEREARLALQIFTVGLDLLTNDWDDLLLHFRVAFEYVHCIQEHVALLHGVLLRQQELDSLTFC